MIAGREAREARTLKLHMIKSYDYGNGPKVDHRPY